MPRQELHLRPETPTRALLRRVQKRSSAGGSRTPPTSRSKRAVTSPSNLQEEVGFEEDRDDGDDNDEEDEEISDLESKYDEMNHDPKKRSARAGGSEALLSVNTSRSPSADKGRLTKAAAAKLEREFASQECILQGLQKDNEAKTIEVEKLRRQTKLMAEHLARHYGVNDWEAMVFGSSASYLKSASTDLGAHPRSENDDVTPARSSKGPLVTTAQRSSAALADSSFYSADETNEEEAARSSSPPAPKADLSAILSLMEAQALLIRGFEKSNTLKMVECNDKIRLAKEREEIWSQKLALHEKSLNTFS
ncbi:hypothetical protein CBS101457_000934 [Exobasidium rhododendri]|nr:hypothetical protein CBS101457_000934 [Exobasidium rhododendri]